MIVFGLVTPLDHPPETTQWVTAWAGGIYILYIYSSAVGCQGKVVEWGSRDQKQSTLPPILAKPKIMGGRDER